MPDGDTTAAPAAAGAAPPPPPVLVSSDPLSPEFGFVRTWLPRYGNGLVAARGFSAGEVCIAEVPMLATEETPAVADDVWEANQRFGIMAQVEVGKARGHGYPVLASACLPRCRHWLQAAGR